MSLSINPKSRVRNLRRIPMPVLAILVGLACGVIAWVILEQVQPKAFRTVFTQELKGRLDQQARETLIRFENYISLHASTTRLLANHRVLSNYLEPLYWQPGDEIIPVLYFDSPPWLADVSLWEALVQPSHILLVDRYGNVREEYQKGQEPLPKEIRNIGDLLLGESRNHALLVTLNNRPYLIVSEEVEDATETEMGALVLLASIDQKFLIASQQGVPESDVVVGIVDGDEQVVLSSSDPDRIPFGSREDVLENDFLITSQSFFQYEGITRNLQFSTLIPSSSVELIEERVAGIERRQRIVAAIVFMAVFTLVFYLLSERLNRILGRISGFSQRALGAEQPLPEKGNQLFVLEDWVKQFISQVREAREEMRRQHESEMQESEALKRAIMEAALDSIVTVNESGVIIEFNPTAEKTFGYQRDDLVDQRPITLLLVKENHQAFRRRLASYLAPAGDLPPETRIEMSAVKRDGQVFPVELTIKPLQLHDRMVFTVYLHDISKRRLAEREIRSLAKFPGESPSPVLRVNRPGVILYANPASEPLLNYWNCSLGQTLPRYWRDRVAGVFNSGEDWETEVVSDNRVYSLLFAAVVELEYVNIYGREITAMRQAENEAREHQLELIHVSRLSTMGEMATGLAHELNQPLSAIANFANGSIRRLQLDNSEIEPILYALDQINLQANRAGEIIKRLRSLVAKQPPMRSVSDMNNLVREVCSFVEFQAKKVGVEIDQDLALCELPVSVDVVQIEQVLLNLLRNALDSLQEVVRDHRRLMVRTQCAEDGQAVRIEIIDTGVGVAPETQKHLFEPFYTTKTSGMGMGLVISQTIIEDHSGNIAVVSQPGVETRFTVTLPSHARGNQRLPEEAEEQ